MTNSGLWYLCQAAAGGIKDGLNAKLFQVKYSYMFAIFVPVWLR